MEHVGVITAAGQELSADKTKKVFKLHLDNPKYTYTLFDDSQKKFAEENIGKTIKAIYEMSPDGKHRNVESLELATAEAYVHPEQNGEGIDTRCAAIIVKDLWVADKIKDDNLLVDGLKRWLGTQLDAWPKTPPVYKDTKGNDPSKATKKHIDELKELLNVDDEELDLQITYRFGFEIVMSDAECKDWIKELKTQ